MRVLFVDVDGPLIPSGMYLIHKNASYDRHFSPISIAVLKHALKESGAKLVMNTTHNLDGHKLKEDMIKAGFKEEDFAKPWCTNYPSTRGRTNAITEWLNEQVDKDIEWIAVDDEDFTSEDRLILIDFDEGLHLRHFNRLAKLWNLKSMLIL